jgi:anti-anti-sigma factor
MLGVETKRTAAGDAQLTVTGELDIASAPDLMTALRRALMGARSVELRLGGVGMVDSIGLEAIVRCRRMAHHRDVELRVVAAPDSAVARLLRRIGLAGALRVHSG